MHFGLHSAAVLFDLLLLPSKDGSRTYDTSSGRVRNSQRRCKTFHGNSSGNFSRFAQRCPGNDSVVKWLKWSRLIPRCPCEQFRLKTMSEHSTECT